MSQAANTTDLLYSTLAGDPDLSEIVDMFVDEMPERIDSLLEQFDGGNLEGVQRVAHQLKGAAGSYGFHPLTPYAARVEDTVRQDDPEERIREAIDELVEMCQRVRAGLPQ